MIGQDNKETLAPIDTAALVDKINEGAGGKIKAHRHVIPDATCKDTAELRRRLERERDSARGTT